MGHITQIGNILHHTVESRQEVAKHMQDNSQWRDYSTHHLEPRNEVSLCSLLITTSIMVEPSL